MSTWKDIDPDDIDIDRDESTVDIHIGDDYGGAKYISIPIGALAEKLGVADILLDAVDTDGAHHKQWYLEKIAEALDIELPLHETGISP